MSSLLFGLAFLIVLLLVYVAKYSGRIRARVQRTMPVRADAVIALLEDWTRWPQWNLWFEPQGLGGALPTTGPVSWDAGYAGAGEARWLGADKGVRRLRLRLARPFRVQAVLRFELLPQPEGTEVRWALDGRVGFSLRAFAATVQQALQLEMAHSLVQLEALASGAPPGYRLEALGVGPGPEGEFCYQRHQGPLSGLRQAVAARFASAREVLEAAGERLPDRGAVFFQRTNPRLGITTCDIGVGGARPAGWQCRTLPRCQTFSAAFHGTGQELEMAWYLAMREMRARGLEPDQRQAPSEHYLLNESGEGRGSVILHLPVRTGPPKGR